MAVFGKTIDQLVSWLMHLAAVIVPALLLRVFKNDTVKFQEGIRF